MKKLSLLYVLILISTISLAQEFVVDYGNIFLKQYSRNYFNKIIQKNELNLDTLNLPFFDDFSASYVYPDSTKWIDKFAFINNNYAKNPMTYNVASLDAVDEFGNVYPHLPSLSSDIADYLTSKPINLAVHPSDSVYFSFFYQAGGNGNMPETKDSLVVQFKTPDLAWTSVWNVAGGSVMSEFKNVLIPITDTLFLVKGFQFRFLNYASISSNYEPSWISNSDHWNIDFVMLDTAKTYTDTIANDVAFIKNFNSMLNGYESVPWKHYKANNTGLVNDSLTWTYRNTGPDVFAINRQVEIIDLLGNNIGFSMNDDNENIDAFETINYSRRIPYIFNSNSVDSAKFLLKGYITTDDSEERFMYRWNDTIRYYQKFENYYAYDDGSAEKAYGISGQNTAYSSLAYQFTPLVSGKLFGVYIYFNKVLNEGNKKYFFLNVWKDDNGIPGDTLFQKIGVLPEYSDDINGFIYYPLDTALLIDTTFYIGWTKTTDDMLNCGFDIHNDASQFLFYNVSGTWENSSIPGALMLRPVFEYEPIEQTNIFEENFAEFQIYPNPANNFINIESFSNNDIVQIFDFTGKLLLSTASKNQIDISDLSSGIYIVKLISNFVNYKTQKLLIAR
ncbi:MAG: T9SS type A sorting domain-containing protein [Bacteroidales bacterium]|jgi:hypothetical protein|nr:T9SS type A sorting domain-containing protein [Bacteroidales bacterium]MCK9498711.1 T9SS type A sorting domain-containing protein [Bacteroidales bacterium]MDY0315237.1 T9SS type A sorting domain-containing protein [Bacteroidales bacterium]NLB86666.1 T9SS type A sorting domain-containing protein [Bacteroidales bacterium]